MLKSWKAVNFLGPLIRVDIYTDPISGKDFEGRAELRQQLRADEGDGLTLWFVRFLEDDQFAQRTVNMANANPRMFR